MKVFQLFVVFIFDPFKRQYGEIEIPELIQETTQGGLVGKLAYQQGLAIFLRDDGDAAKPIGNGATQCSFKSDAIHVSMVYFFLIHIGALSHLLIENIQSSEPA